MATRKILANTYIVNLLCDECGSEEMEFCNIRHNTYPPRYPHECKECGNRQSERKIYPAIEHEEKPWEE